MNARQPDDANRRRRRQMRQCPTHGLDLVMTDPMPCAPRWARFACPDKFCEHAVRSDRFALFVDL